MHRPERERLVEISLFAVLFLVFFQLLTTFIEKTYVFGLLQTDIPAEIAFVLFLLLPVFYYSCVNQHQAHFWFTSDWSCWCCVG
jgi:hypothetical protein